MSVINKALKDLERRHGADLAQDPLSQHVHSVPVAPRKRIGMASIGGFAVVVAAGVVGWYTLQPRGGAAPGAPAAPPSPVVVAAAPAPAAPAPSEAAPAGPANAAAASGKTVPPAPAAAAAPVTVAAASAAAVTAVPVAHVAAAQAAPETRPAAASAARPATPVVAKAGLSPAEPAAAKVAEKAAPQPAEKAAGKPVEKVAAQTLETPVEKPTAEPASRVAKGETKTRLEPKPVVMAPGIVKSATHAPGVEVAAVTPPADGRLERSVAPQQQSDNLYKQALLMLQQGNGIEARPLLRRALQANPANGAARQALANLLIESNNLAEAATLLREGTQQSPERPSLWTTLARLQVEQGDSPGALVTLDQGASHAGDDAGFNALYAVMLQRTGRHDDAVKHFLTALRTDPAMPNWLVGIGISLQALGRDGDALQAFQRARDGGRLPPSLVAFVDARLEQLKQR